jgi:hypothetical protein
VNGISPIINVNRLKPFRSPGDEVVRDGGEKEWEVDEILGHRRYQNDVIRFKVKWKAGDETWEPLKSLVDWEDGERVFVNKLNS